MLSYWWIGRCKDVCFINERFHKWTIERPRSILLSFMHVRMPLDPCTSLDATRLCCFKNTVVFVRKFYEKGSCVPRVYSRWFTDPLNVRWINNKKKNKRSPRFFFSTDKSLQIGVLRYCLFSRVRFSAWTWQRFFLLLLVDTIGLQQVFVFNKPVRAIQHVGASVCRAIAWVGSLLSPGLGSRSLGCTTIYRGGLFCDDIRAMM